MTEQTHTIEVETVLPFMCLPEHEDAGLRGETICDDIRFCHCTDSAAGQVICKSLLMRSDEDILSLRNNDERAVVLKSEAEVDQSLPQVGDRLYPISPLGAKSFQPPGCIERCISHQAHPAS